MIGQTIGLVLCCFVGGFIASSGGLTDAWENLKFLWKDFRK